MWHGVPFARHQRPIVGVLRMCWLLPGSFDCFCCPHASVHSLCPSFLSAVLALVPPSVGPAFYVFVLLLPMFVGAPGCPCRGPTPVPPACPPPPPPEVVYCCVSRWGSSHCRVWGGSVPSCFAACVPPNFGLFLFLLARSPLPVCGARGGGGGVGLGWVGLSRLEKRDGPVN